MNHYNALNTLHELWEHAVAAYRTGNRSPQSFFTPEQVNTFRKHGLKHMDFYDYAEDFVSGGEPDFATFIAVHSVRRSYFLIEQKGIWSTDKLAPSSLPPKSDSIEGIVWLPRILPKARAKLRGTLDDSIMFGCGGDRRFFRNNNLHPAEFLQVVWSAGKEDAPVVDYVKNRAR